MCTDKHFSHKIRRLGLWLIVMGIVLFTGIYAFRSILIAPYAIAFLQRTVAIHLGLDIKIGQLGGSYFSNIEIKNVTTEKRIADGLFIDLKLDDANVTYNLIDLFKGLPTFLAQTSINLNGGLLSIDLTKMTETEDSGSNWPDLQLPPTLPLIRVSDSSLKVKGFEYEAAFKGITLMSRNTRPPASRIKLHISEWSFRHPDFRNIAASLEADIIYAETNLTLENMVVGKQTIVESVAIDLSALPSRMQFQSVINPAGGRLDVSGLMDANRLHVQLSGYGIDLKQISNLLASEVTQFGGILSLQGHLDLPLKEPNKIETALNIEVSGVNVNGITTESLAFTFVSENGSLEISDLELINDTNRLSISKASVSAEAVFNNDSDALLQSLFVDWYLKGSNIPLLLKLLGLRFEKHDEQIPSHTLKLRGIIDDGEIQIRNGVLDTDNGYIRLQTARITLPNKEHTLVDSQLTAIMQVDLPNIKILSQIFALPALGGSIQGHIQIAGTLKAPLGRAKLNCNAITYQNIEVGDLSIRAEANIKHVAIETLTIKRGNDRANVRGTINWMEKSFEDIQGELDVKDLDSVVADVIPLFWHRSEKFPRIQGVLKGTIKLSGAFTKPDGILNLQTRHIRIDGTPFGNADVDLSLSQEELRVSSAEFRNSNDRLHLQGKIHHQLKQLKDLNIIVKISDLSAYSTLWQQASISISGSLNGQMHASGALLNPDADAELQVENLRLQSIHIDSGLAKLKSANHLLTIESAKIKTTEGTIQIAGQVQRNVDDTEFDVTLEKASIIGQDTLLALERTQKCRLFHNGRVIFNNLTFTGSAGRLSVSGTFNPDGKSDLLITVADLRSDGWLGMIASDRTRFQGLNAQIKFLGPVYSPILTVIGSLDYLGSRDIPMAFSGKFNIEYKDRYVKIHEFFWSGKKGQQIYLGGNLPLDPFGSKVFSPGQLELTGRMQIIDASILDFIVPWAEGTGGSVHCDLKLAGTWAHPTGTLRMEMKDIEKPDSIKPLPPGPYTVSVNVRINGNSVSLERLEANSVGWKVSAQGQWTGAPSPVDVFLSQKHTLTGQVNFEGSLNVSDLNWLAQEITGIRRLSGGLEVHGTVRGPIISPTAYATIKLSDAELSPDFDMPVLGNLNVETSVTPAVIAVQKFTGEIGGAPFDLAGAVKTTTGPDSEVDFKLKGENILLYRDESVRLRADTHLALKGPVAKMELSGEVAVTDGGFFKNFGILEGFEGITKSDTGGGFQLFSIRESPFNDLRFNVRITAKEPFLVRNNLARGSVRPDLLLTGTGEVPLLVGKVYVEPTRLYLPAGRMNLQAGMIRFEQTEPDRPKLDLLGTATMQSFDITAVIEGPYDEPVVTLSSVPPLPDDELLMLLLAGKPPRSSGSRSSSRHRFSGRRTCKSGEARWHRVDGFVDDVAAQHRHHPRQPGKGLRRPRNRSRQTHGLHVWQLQGAGLLRPAHLPPSLCQGVCRRGPCPGATHHGAVRGRPGPLPAGQGAGDVGGHQLPGGVRALFRGDRHGPGAGGALRGAGVQGPGGGIFG